MSQRLTAGNAVAQFEKDLILAVEACLHLLLGVKSLDDAQASETLLDVRPRP